MSKPARRLCMALFGAIVIGASLCTAWPDARAEVIATAPRSIGPALQAAAIEETLAALADGDTLRPVGSGASPPLAEARAAFFASLDDPALRPAAEARFAALLWKKDGYLLAHLLQPGNRILKALERIAGPDLDGGIRPAERDAFAALLQGVRRSLGATTAAAPIVISSKARLARALQENVALYNAYKAQRDAAEFAAAFSSSRTRSSLQALGGGVNV